MKNKKYLDFGLKLGTITTNHCYRLIAYAVDPSFPYIEDAGNFLRGFLGTEAESLQISLNGVGAGNAQAFREEEEFGLSNKNKEEVKKLSFDDIMVKVKGVIKGKEDGIKEALRVMKEEREIRPALGEKVNEILRSKEESFGVTYPDFLQGSTLDRICQDISFCKAKKVEENCCNTISKSIIGEFLMPWYEDNAARNSLPTKIEKTLKSLKLDRMSPLKILKKVLDKHGDEIIRFNTFAQEQKHANSGGPKRENYSREEPRYQQHLHGLELNSAPRFPYQQFNQGFQPRFSPQQFDQKFQPEFQNELKFSL